MLSVLQTREVDEGSVDSHGALRLHPARPPARAVFKAGLGRDGSHREEMKGLAGKPQRKGKGTGADTAADNGQLRQGLCNAHSKQVHPHSSEALASSGPLSQPSTKASPRPEIRAKAPALSHSSLQMWGWVSMGTRPSSAQWQF